MKKTLSMIARPHMVELAGPDELGARVTIEVDDEVRVADVLDPEGAPSIDHWLDFSDHAWLERRLTEVSLSRTIGELGAMANWARTSGPRAQQWATAIEVEMKW